MSFVLGLHAPPYIVIMISIAMLSAVTGIAQQYYANSVNLRFNKFFFDIFSLMNFIYFFFVSSCILFTASIMNVFSEPSVFSNILQWIIKIFLAISSICLAYSAKEYLRRFREELEENGDSTDQSG